MAAANRRGVSPYVIYSEKKKREFDMAQARRQAEVKLEPATFTERIVAASLGTVALLFGIYLAVDVLMGWGMGFVVGALTALGIAMIGALSAIAALWRWVYKGSGRYQMGKS
ncbi:membrane protein [Microbacterium phage Zooman]|nr:membrane protein [Microbacterium phage Zooman]